MSRSASFTMFNTPKPKPSGRVSRQSTKSECFNDEYFADDLSHGFKKKLLKNEKLSLRNDFFLKFFLTTKVTKFEVLLIIKLTILGYLIVKFVHKSNFLAFEFD